MKSHIVVLVMLIASNLVNVLFLFLDPRNPSFPLFIQVAFMSAGILYFISLLLCLRKKRACYYLNILLAIASSPVVVLDNLNISLPYPTQIIYFSNLIFFAVQILLVVFSIRALKARRE